MSSTGGKITKIKNVYEEIPKKFLLPSNNPNKDLHGFNLPMRALIIGPSGSSKTNFLYNLIEQFCVGKGTFVDIHIISKDLDEPIYNYLSEKCKGIVMTEGIRSLPDLSEYKEEKQYNKLVVLDDLVNEKNQEAVKDFYIRCRKLNCSIIYIAQSYFLIPKLIRQNVTNVIFLKIGSNRDLKLILSEYGLSIPRETLIKMYDYATAEKFVPFIIDIGGAGGVGTYRKGFSELLNPNDFK